MRRFEGKVALITGAGQGIGYQIAESLVREGAYVIINDSNKQVAKCATERIDKLYPGKSVEVIGNASKPSVINELIGKALHTFGKLDLVVANAGCTLFGNFFEYTEAQFDQTMEVNLKGTFFLVQKAAKAMVEAGTGGRIVLMSSTLGLMAYPDLTAYSMTKAAIQMMAKSLVLDLACHDITINTIAPGATLTERTSKEEKDYEAYWSKLIPRKKPANTQDIANAALFLLAAEAAHITGQTLVVDGGWSSVGNNSNEAKGG